MICKHCRVQILEEDRYGDGRKVWVHVRGKHTKAGRLPVRCFHYAGIVELVAEPEERDETVRSNP